MLVIMIHAKKFMFHAADSFLGEIYDSLVVFSDRKSFLFAWHTAARWVDE